MSLRRVGTARLLLSSPRYSSQNVRTLALFCRHLAALIWVLYSATTVVAQDLSCDRIGPFGTSISRLMMTEEGALLAGTPFGIYRSTNDGSSWESVVSSEAIVASESGPEGEIAAATFEGTVFFSRDAGLTWSSSDSGVPITSLAFGPTGVLYAGGECLVVTSHAAQCDSAAGPFRSADDGVNWERVGLDNGDVRDSSVGLDGRVFALVGSGFAFADAEGRFAVPCRQR